MTRKGVLAVVTLLLNLSGAAWAQETPVSSPCAASVACLRQMVQDLRDHRQYLEDQLALAKSLVQAANQRIREQAEELRGLRVPGEAPEKK